MTEEGKKQTGCSTNNVSGLVLSQIKEGTREVKKEIPDSQILDLLPLVLRSTVLAAARRRWAVPAGMACLAAGTDWRALP